MVTMTTRANGNEKHGNLVWNGKRWGGANGSDSSPRSHYLTRTAIAVWRYRNRVMYVRSEGFNFFLVGDGWVD